jgi:hypothetical protein
MPSPDPIRGRRRIPPPVRPEKLSPLLLCRLLLGLPLCGLLLCGLLLCGPLLGLLCSLLLLWQLSCPPFCAPRMHHNLHRLHLAQTQSARHVDRWTASYLTVARATTAPLCHTTRVFSHKPDRSFLCNASAPELVAAALAKREGRRSASAHTAGCTSASDTAGNQKRKRSNDTEMLASFTRWSGDYASGRAPRDPGRARLAAKQCQSQAGARPDGGSSLLAHGQDGVFVEDDEILTTKPHLCSSVLRVDDSIADLN